MRKLIVHAGTHKTATTSFQTICFKNRDQLTKNGIFYPLLTFCPNDPVLAHTISRNKGNPESIPQHSFLPRLLFKNKLTDVSIFLKNALTSADQQSCETTLLSGEDFESCLVDTSIACNFRDIAIQAGYDEIRFVITKRSAIDYFHSLYNQLATQRIPCNAISLYETINSHGYASFSSMHGVFHYVFDLFAAAQKFEQSTNISCQIMNYKDFLDVYPGYNVLQSINPRPKKQIKDLNIKPIKSNTTFEKGNIEFLHACAYLSLNPDQTTYFSNTELFQVIIKRREAILLHATKLAEQDFKRFD